MFAPQRENLCSSTHCIMTRISLNGYFPHNLKQVNWFSVEFVRVTDYFNGFLYFLCEIIGGFGNNRCTDEENLVSSFLMMFCFEEFERGRHCL